MSTPYIGEVRMFAGNFAPDGWQICAGQLLSIAENDALFALIGTQYGGDGETTFALPDLRGRIPIHQGDGFSVAQAGGAEMVSLTVNQIPPHNHAWMASSESAGGQSSPGDAVLARTPGADVYTTDVVPIPLSPQMINDAGGGQSHDNVQPFICINFIIALFGIFPSQD